MPLTVTDVDAQPKKSPRKLDATLALCSRLDRAFEKLPDYGREIVRMYLEGKWKPRNADRG